MGIDVLDSLLDIGKSAIERIWPDPIRRAEEIRKLEELRQSGDIARLDAHVKLMVGQLEVNKAEAQSKSVFVAGWRPFIGWVGGSALLYQYIVYPLLTWVAAVYQFNAPPLVDSDGLYPIILGMLGVAGMRSYDKKQGTQTDSIK